MPLYITSEKWREKVMKTEWYLFTRIPRYLLKTMTPLFDTKIHVRKSKAFSLKCPATEARALNTNCSAVQALVARRGLAQFQGAGRCVSCLWLRVVLVVVSCLTLLKHTCSGSTCKLSRQGVARGEKGAFLGFQQRRACSRAGRDGGAKLLWARLTR